MVHPGPLQPSWPGDLAERSQSLVCEPRATGTQAVTEARAQRWRFCWIIGVHLGKTLSEGRVPGTCALQGSAHHQLCGWTMSEGSGKAEWTPRPPAPSDLEGHPVGSDLGEMALTLGNWGPRLEPLLSSRPDPGRWPSPVTRPGSYPPHQARPATTLEAPARPLRPNPPMRPVPNHQGPHPPWRLMPTCEACIHLESRTHPRGPRPPAKACTEGWS